MWLRLFLRPGQSSAPTVQFRICPYENERKPPAPDNLGGWSWDGGDLPARAGPPQHLPAPRARLALTGAPLTAPTSLLPPGPTCPAPTQTLGGRGAFLRHLGWPWGQGADGEGGHDQARLALPAAQRQTQPRGGPTAGCTLPRGTPSQACEMGESQDPPPRDSRSRTPQGPVGGCPGGKHSFPWGRSPLGVWEGGTGWGASPSTPLAAAEAGPVLGSA